MWVLDFGSVCDSCVTSGGLIFLGFSFLGHEMEITPVQCKSCERKMKMTTEDTAQI